MRGRGDRIEAVLAERELERIAGTTPDQRPLPDRLHRYQRRLRLRSRHPPLLHRLPLHERAATEVEGWEAITVAATGLARSPSSLVGRTGFEDDHMAVRVLEKLKEKLPRGFEPVAAGGAVEGCGESRTPRSWRRSPPPRSWPTRSGSGRRARPAGRSERDVALPRKRGSASSAPTRPSGDRRRRSQRRHLPHAEPGEREIGRGEWRLDMGAKLDGYCSTAPALRHRRPREEARAVYEVVREAQQASSTRSRPRRWRSGRHVARKVIEAAGAGDRFGHGLGHGVGLEVHEVPAALAALRRSPRPNEVVTVEPGRLPVGKLGGGAERGPGRRHRGRPAQPQQPAERASVVE